MTDQPIYDDTLGAFCRDSGVFVKGIPEGPLSGLTFGAKDIFDVAGYVTGGGNPDWKATHKPAEKTAWVVKELVEAGATLVGKTHTDELTRGIFGENVHYGTPTNPRARSRVPGGSSSGSAAAVAGNLVDFALGSDTLGSVRIPASYCGLFGIRPTHGRISLDGMLLQAPSYDTIGWFARDAELLKNVGSILLNSQGSPAIPKNLLVAVDAFEACSDGVANVLLPLAERIGSILGQTITRMRLSPNGLADWHHQQLILQSVEAWESVKDWVDKVNPRMSFLVAQRYVFAREISSAQVQEAKKQRALILGRMDEVLVDDTVVCMPTSASPARPIGERLSKRQVVQQSTYDLVTVASTIGAPQVSLPIGEVSGLPVGLSLMGKRGSDEMLLELAGKIHRDFK